MSFYESPVFPDYLAYGLQVGPMFSSTVVRTLSGSESRNQLWENALHSFDGATTHRTQAERDVITDFFLAMRGRVHSFRVRDVSDYNVVASEGVFEAVGSPTAYQLMKLYASGSLTYYRPIYKPRSAISITGGGSYTVDYTTGIVTRNSGAAPTAWTGTFDIPARFDQDELMWEVAAPHGNSMLYLAQQMRIVETRDIT